MEQVQILSRSVAFAIERGYWPYSLGLVNKVERRAKQSRECVCQCEPSSFGSTKMSALSLDFYDSHTVLLYLLGPTPIVLPLSHLLFCHLLV